MTLYWIKKFYYITLKCFLSIQLFVLHPKETATKINLYTDALTSRNLDDVNRLAHYPREIKIHLSLLGFDLQIVKRNLANSKGRWDTILFMCSIIMIWICSKHTILFKNLHLTFVFRNFDFWYILMIIFALSPSMIFGSLFQMVVLSVFQLLY